MKNLEICKNSLGIALACLLAMPLGEAFAITVTGTSDNVAAGDGMCTLREALNNANADMDTTSGDCEPGVGEDIITFSAITDGQPITLVGPTGDDANVGGDLDVIDDDGLTIQGNGTSQTIVQAGPSPGNGVDRILQAHTLVPSLVVNDLTFRHGVAATSSGGGILFGGENGASLTLRGCRLQGNSAMSGGGVLFGTTGGMLTVEDCQVIHNQATGATTTGGGLRVDASDTIIRVDGSGFFSNSAMDAAGISLAGGSGTAEILNSNVGSNSAVRDAGGVLMGFTNGSLLIRGSTLLDNTAGRNGGGLAVSATGAIGGSVVLVNSTISGNQAGGSGGGISVGDALGGDIDALTMIFSTVANNTADSDVNGDGDGGGLNAFSGSVQIGSSIIADNQDGGGESPQCSGAIDVSLGHNLLQSVDGCVFPATIGDLVGVDALLHPLGQNGGPTSTHALQPGSPAQNGGESGMFCTSAPVAGEDQRGVVRDPLCDIGAFESAETLILLSIPALGSLGLILLCALTLLLGVWMQYRGRMLRRKSEPLICTET